MYNCWSLKHCRQRTVLVFSTQTKGEAQLAVSLTDSNLASFLKWYGKVAEQQLSKQMAIGPPLNQYPCASLNPFGLSSWHVDCPSTYRRCKESEVCQVGSGETPASSPGFSYLIPTSIDSLGSCPTALSVISFLLPLVGRTPPYQIFFICTIHPVKAAAP